MYKNFPERRQRENREMPMGAFHTSGAAAQTGAWSAGARAASRGGQGWFRCDSVLYYKTSRTQNCSPPHPHYMLYVTIAAFCYDTRTRRRAPRGTLSGDSFELHPRTRCRSKREAPKGLSRFFSAAPGTQSCYYPMARSVARPLAGSAQWPRVGAAPASAGFCGCRDSCWAPDLCRQG